MTDLEKVKKYYNHFDEWNEVDYPYFETSSIICLMVSLIDCTFVLQTS